MVLTLLELKDAMKLHESQLADKIGELEWRLQYLSTEKDKGNENSGSCQNYIKFKPKI